MHVSTHTHVYTHTHTHTHTHAHTYTDTHAHMHTRTRLLDFDDKLLAPSLRRLRRPACLNFVLLCLVFSFAFTKDTDFFAKEPNIPAKETGDFAILRVWIWILFVTLSLIVSTRYSISNFIKKKLICRHMTRQRQTRRASSCRIDFCLILVQSSWRALRGRGDSHHWDVRDDDKFVTLSLIVSIRCSMSNSLLYF